MPTVAYEIIVGQRGEMNQNVAVANAAKEIAGADTTGSITFADIFDVNMYGGPTSNQDYGIGICLALPVGGARDKARFERELEALAKVETYEEIHYERIQ